MQLIQCQICQKQFKRITKTHLASHGLSIKEYCEQFPTALIIAPELQEQIANKARERNALLVGTSRSEETREKIRLTKGKNKRPAWNKGIPKSAEQKHHISQVKKQQYETGEVVHWNEGNITSEETKQKIRESLAKTREERGFAMSEESIEKRNNTLKEKQENGWIHPSTRRKGTKSTLSKEERYEKFYLSNPTRIAFVNEQKQKKLNRLDNYLTPFNLTLLSISDDQYNYTLKCNICNTIFNRTKSVFVPSKAPLYDGEFCPTCYPPIGGYYTYQLFENRPELKNQSGTFYIIELKDNDTIFLKIGITNRNVKERYRSEDVILHQILIEHKTTLFKAYDLEYTILHTVTDRYEPTTTFGGLTECYSLDKKDEIIEIYNQYFNT